MRHPSKAVLLTGLAFLFVATFHVPVGVFPHGFDKTAPAQLVAIAIVAAIYSIYIAVNISQFQCSRKMKQLIIGVLAALFSSALLSGNIIGSFIGDTGRFVGVISSYSLILVAIFHARFTFLDFKYLVALYIAVIEIIVLIGLAQHWSLVELPGDNNLTSTLGNVDFFAALVGTSFPLFIYLAVQTGKRIQLVILGAAILNIYALKLAGPLQAWVDVALILFITAIAFLARNIRRPEISLNKRTYLATFGVVIWAEFIFLMPFLGKMIPVLGNDMQVKIRANFWIAGLRQFFSHPILGVGPDQYGSYYEKFRTIDDVKNWPNVLSNDAHSASVQTLATLGIVGALLYLALIAFVIRALLIMWDGRIYPRKAVAALALYLFIYLTNSFISPITLAHKYLFWAVCGFIVGQVYLRKVEHSSQFERAIFIFPAISLLAFSALFSNAHINYLAAMEKYADDNSAKITYQYNPLLPCFMYGDAQLLIDGNFGKEAQLRRANILLDNNPRCVQALTFLAAYYSDRDDTKALAPFLTRLDDAAPYRATTIQYEMFYANRTGDSTLATRIGKRMKELGLVYVPGKLG